MNTLKLGSTGADVSTWQQLLTDAGFTTQVTGTFDAATESSTRAWQKQKGLVVDGIVGPQSWSAMTGKPVTPVGSTDKNAAFGREVLEKVWPKVTGEIPSLAELQIAGAQAHLESNYGKSSYKLLDHETGKPIATSGPINNWGAVQTSNPAEGFLATDTSPLKATADNPKGYYDHHYKVYATPEEGAEHFVKHLTVLRPTSWELMKLGDIDSWAQQMWAGYVNGKLNKDPISGTLGYFEQKPNERAKGIEQRIANIAYTLNEPVAAKRGGPMPPPEPPELEDEGEGEAPIQLPPVTRTGLYGAAMLLVATGVYFIGKGLGWLR